MKTTKENERDMKDITFLKSFVHEGKLIQAEQKGDIIKIGGRMFYKHWEGGMLGACVITESITGCLIAKGFNEDYLQKEVLARMNSGMLDNKIRDVVGRYKLTHPINNL